MDDYTFDDREKAVEDLQSYLTECQNEVSHILEGVGWTPEHFIQQRDIVSCSFDSSHRMPRKCLDKHEQKCELLFVGYRKEDLEDVIAQSQFFSDEFQREKNTVLIDKEKMNRVLRDHHVQNHSLFFAHDKVPLTPDDFTVELTPPERAAMYSYVVQKAREEKKLTALEADQFLSTDLQEIIKQRELGDKSKPKSYIDYLAAQRDYKRRRQSYRAKNVHITRKSYTEIIREVIENQTEYLSTVRQSEEEERSNKLEEEKAKYEEVAEEENYSRRDIVDRSKRREDIVYKDREKDVNLSRERDESKHKGRDKSKKKKKSKKHKHHKHRHRSSSESRSRSRSRSDSRSGKRSNSRS